MCHTFSELFEILKKLPIKLLLAAIYRLKVL